MSRKYLSIEERAKISQALKGRKLSQETKNKISKTKLSRVNK